MSRRRTFAVLAAATALCAASHAGAITQYTYTGAQYNFSGCADTYCTGGPYALTVVFDVAAGTPLDSLSNVNITADVTSFSFSDGSGFVITQASPGLTDSFVISTDPTGNMTVWSLNACTSPPPYFEPGSAAGAACMETYWIPAYPQVLDRTSWTDGSVDGQCFAYGTGVVATSGCLGNWGQQPVGGSAPEPSTPILTAAGLLSLALCYRRGNLP